VEPLVRRDHRQEILPRVLIINGRSQLKTRSPWAPRRSGIDLIDDLEVGEVRPRCEPFDFLLARVVGPIKKCTLLGGQLRRLFGARHGDWIMLSQRRTHFFDRRRGCRGPDGRPRACTLGQKGDHPRGARPMRWTYLPAVGAGIWISGGGWRRVRPWRGACDTCLDA